MKLDLYMKYRDRIDTGDGMFWKSKDLIGRIICWVDGMFSHSSEVLHIEEFEGLKDRRYILESTEKGLYPALLSEEIQDFHGEVWWYPLNPVFHFMRDSMIIWPMEHLGTKYDFRGLIANILGHVSADAARLFCSETLYFAVIYSGLKLIWNYEDAPRPRDMARMQVQWNDEAIPLYLPGVRLA